jgi:hypothetical protein
LKTIGKRHKAVMKPGLAAVLSDSKRSHQFSVALTCY